MLNVMVAESNTNDQYATLVDPATRQYKTSSEMSIEFEVDGPYKVALLYLLLCPATSCIWGACCVCYLLCACLSSVASCMCVLLDAVCMVALCYILHVCATCCCVHVCAVPYLAIGYYLLCQSIRLCLLYVLCLIAFILSSGRSPFACGPPPSYNLPPKTVVCSK